jgi:hypothetical protein
MTATTRSPEQVFDHHAQVLGAGDLEGIVSDYSDDAIVICQGETYRGKDGVRRVFTRLLSDVPQASWQLPTMVFAEDVMYLEWKAQSAERHVDDGIDTFVFSDGQIRVQTVRYTLSPS